MLITLGLILLILIMVVGGDRGVVSLIALCGNLLILSLAIWLMASGVPVLLVTVCVGVVISCITLFYQNGSNRKTWSAFLATMITMLLLFSSYISLYGEVRREVLTRYNRLEKMYFIII